MNDPLHNYATAVNLHHQGRLHDAEQYYRAALHESPGHPGVMHGLGVLCVQTNRFQEAAELFRRAAAAAPNEPDIRNHYGLMLSRFRRYEDAAAEFEAALEASPEFAEARKNLGETYLRLGRLEMAADAFEMVLAQHPAHVEALVGLGDVLCMVGKPAAAQHVYEKILAIDPRLAVAHFGMATVMIHLGRFAEARAALERAIALRPKVPAFHRALAELERFQEGDPRLAALEHLAQNEQNFSDEQRTELHFALAKACDDLGQYDRAFEHLEKGNALKRRQVHYDEAAAMRAFAQLATAFSGEAVAARSGVGYPSERPVFVVGMPRSGTSLIEQILASHPDVFGAGELTFVTELIAEGYAGLNYPSQVPSAAAIRDFGAGYVARLAALAPGSPCIVDKLPGNFAHLALIHLALPKARIIHVKRDARDTCVSCYSKLFRGVHYSYDLGELGRYYKAYERLMAHWRAVLPPGAMLEIDYERLVDNLEAEARRLIAFVGLPWDDRCLRFQETKRAVRTHSEVQVRQPLFKSSVSRWRNYEAHLKPLIDALS